MHRYHFWWNAYILDRTAPRRYFWNNYNKALKELQKPTFLTNKFYEIIKSAISWLIKLKICNYIHMKMRINQSILLEYLYIAVHDLLPGHLHLLTILTVMHLSAYRLWQRTDYTTVHLKHEIFFWYIYSVTMYLFICGLNYTLFTYSFFTSVYIKGW